MANIITVSRKSYQPIETLIEEYFGCIEISSSFGLVKNLYLRHKGLKCLLIALHSAT